MADQETELEWEKSKRIEAERMKAARALADAKPDKSNLAFLDPKSTKVKGWTNDSDVIIANSERMSTRAVALAVGGVVLMIIGYAGGMVTSGFSLGAAGMIISALPSGAGALLVGIGALMSLAVIGVEVFYKIKSKRRLTQSFWTAVFTISFVAICGFIISLLMKFT